MRRTWAAVAAKPLIAPLAAVSLAAIALAAGGSVSSGDTGTGTPWKARARLGDLREASARYGLSVAVPPGWHASRTRLVPRLLAPREVLSLGDFGMRVGGGGNCGREPAASIARMRRGDALVSLQEVPVFPRLRARLRHSYPPLQRRFRFDDLRRVSGPGGAGRLRSATLAFSKSGRAFDALVYVDGPTSPGLRAAVDAILGGLRVRPGSWGRYHGDERPST